MEAHILCRSSSHVAFSWVSGVLVMSLKTKSRTVFLLLGAGVKSLRLTCRTDLRGTDSAKYNMHVSNLLASKHNTLEPMHQTQIVMLCTT